MPCFSPRRKWEPESLDSPRWAARGSRLLAASTLRPRRWRISSRIGDDLERVRRALGKVVATERVAAGDYRAMSPASIGDIAGASYHRDVGRGAEPREQANAYSDLPAGQHAHMHDMQIFLGRL